MSYRISKTLSDIVIYINLCKRVEENQRSSSQLALLSQISH